MYTKPTRSNQQTLFFNLESQLNQKHPLYLLANKIDWNVFEEAFNPLYCEDNGRPCKPIRRMVGLLRNEDTSDLGGEIIITDAIGRVLRHCTMEDAEMRINTSCYGSGTYFVRYRSKNGVQILKFAKAE